MNAKHRLTLDGDQGFERETSNPVVYLDAYRGWVREVPGTLVPPALWFRVESVITGQVFS